jgi:hypothetical protein
MLRRLLAAALLLTAAAATVSAQSQYDQMYGKAVDVTIADLIHNGPFYMNQAVRTHGRIQMLSQAESANVAPHFALSSALASIQIVAVPEIGQEFEADARFHVGTDLYLTGIVREMATQSDPAFSSGYLLEFWRYEVRPEHRADELAKAKLVTITDLTRKPGRYDGQLVHIAGAFRGRNLFGDLPARSERGSNDWVLMDQDNAVWVTGRKPRGSGWALDVSLKVDSGKWIDVIGRPETKGGVIYMHAEQVSLSHAPDQATVAEATPPPPDKPKVPPVVVFALPLDGETSVPGDSRFVVQFSKDMDESTFKGHVQLQYIGPPRPGMRLLDSVSLSYDQGRRALTVDPGDRLWRGGELELKLLPGIKDLDGLELIRRDSALAPRATVLESAEQDVVDVLRFRVGT